MLTKGVRFYHDSARPHTAHQTTALIEEFGWELVSHPPYSPDIAPSDFHLFPELKKNLGGTQFQDDDELEEAVLGFLRGQAAEFFDSGFHKLEPTARARSLFFPLQFPTKDTSLVSLVLAEQPLVMELPLVSPASCELRSVIRFLAAKKNSAKDIHTELCQVYEKGCMSSGMVRRWVREFKNGRTDVHDEPRAGRPSVSDETIAKVEAAMLED
ncbi:hypothetical protein LAZ67_2005878 [Cordylochernes scorpioides]|uniref:Mos1 transposase HTH domain-containing protein n=1 Tax=Cordylochernes scorpioides TaxID=51811 RepID=A0ABY6K5Q7_9ARAC|nr:hypothetical protein LAZ67_2005878 [Cordylochernes scorpioides]